MNKLANVLSSDAFIPLNKTLLAHFKSLETTAILGYLIDKYKYFATRNSLTIVDGKEYFYNTQEDIESALHISVKMQRKYRNDLVSMGLIETRLMGLPAKVHYYINFDKIGRLLDGTNIDKSKKTAAVRSKSPNLVGRNILQLNNLLLNNSELNNKETEDLVVQSPTDTDEGNLFEEVLSAVEVNIYSEPNYRRPAVKTSILPFDEFWLMYNKSNSKAAVKKKYEKVKETDRQKIKEHLPKYILSTPDKIYRKNALTYLNQECWEDEVVIKNNFNTAENSNSKTPPKNNRLMM